MSSITNKSTGHSVDVAITGILSKNGQSQEFAMTTLVIGDDSRVRFCDGDKNIYLDLVQYGRKTNRSANQIGARILKERPILVSFESFARCRESHGVTTQVEESDEHAFMYDTDAKDVFVPHHLCMTKDGEIMVSEEFQGPATRQVKVRISCKMVRSDRLQLLWSDYNVHREFRDELYVHSPGIIGRSTTDLFDAPVQIGPSDTLKLSNFQTDLEEQQGGRGTTRIDPGTMEGFSLLTPGKSGQVCVKVDPKNVTSVTIFSRRRPGPSHVMVFPKSK